MFMLLIKRPVLLSLFCIYLRVQLSPEILEKSGQPVIRPCGNSPAAIGHLRSHPINLISVHNAFNFRNVVQRNS